MLSPCITLGIDVSQDWLDLYVHPLGHARRIPNHAQGMAQLAQLVREFSPQRAVCEATGGLERPLMRTLRQEGIATHRVNPARITGYRTACGRLAKTDPLDAELIARFAAQMTFDDHLPQSAAEQALKDLAARRRQLVEMQTGERNRLKRCLDDRGQGSIRRVLALLQAEREAIEADMLACLEQDDALRRRREILTSIPGIGTVVALTLLSDMPELGRIGDKQASALAGIAPQDRQSGHKTARASIRGGRKCTRAALYMAALSAKRYNPAIKNFYDRLVENGKPKMVALIAAMRKLLILANRLLTENRTWNPQPSL